MSSRFITLIVLALVLIGGLWFALRPSLEVKELASESEAPSIDMPAPMPLPIDPVEMAPEPEFTEAMPIEEFAMEEMVIMEEALIVDGEEEGLDYDLVRLFFGTNRGLNTGDFDTPAEAFSNDDSGKLHYGRAEVSIPFNHQTGHLEAPHWLTSFIVAPNPEKHVVLMSMDVGEREDILAQLRAALQSDGNQVLVYIHGYNTGVDMAARRAGQLTYDLKWQGPSFFFSWPSQGGFEDYGNDQEKARGSRKELRKMFEDIAATDTDRIVVIAHSMGNDLLTQTLEMMHFAGSKALDKITTVVLAAPDINADNFMSDIVPVFAAMKAQNDTFNVTLYASENDSALQVSQVVNGVRRIGRVPQPTTEERAAMKPVTVVDASSAVSDFFDHTYINANATVIEDVYCMLYQDAEPANRKRTLVPSPDVTLGPGFAIKLDNSGTEPQFICD